MHYSTQFILRLGVAFSFLYPPLNALGNPDSWVGYFPPFLLNSGIPSEVLLHGFGVVEVAVALWLLSGWRVYWPAALAALMLAGIVVFNLSQFEVLFRDLSIAAAALALAVDAWYKKVAVR
ncbi:MAG TPA: DoxX family membrane protein [Candidatus Paceibacterota bacterium]